MVTRTRDLHDERAIAFFGTWMVIGLYLDGWAHNVQKPETFFSLWHLVLYSGFGAAVAYFVFRGYVLKKRSDPDRITKAGLVLFIIGAVGDGMWHQIFGIEVSLEALLSPTHLALMIGGLMMLGIAYRSAERAEPRDEIADASLIVTMTLCAAVVMFFTQYFNTFRFHGVFSQTGDRDLQIWQVHAIGSVFVTNAILLVPTFLLVRRWRTPRWTFTFVYGALASANVALDGRRGAWLHVPAAVLAGVVTDVLVRRLRPSRSDARIRVFSGAVPFAISGLWFLALQLHDGVHWPAEVWTGTIILAVLEGIALGLLAFPSGAARTVDTRPPLPGIEERTPGIV